MSNVFYHQRLQSFIRKGDGWICKGDGWLSDEMSGQVGR
jgi:hypothetical protein